MEDPEYNEPPEYERRGKKPVVAFVVFSSCIFAALIISTWIFLSYKEHSWRKVAPPLLNLRKESPVDIQTGTLNLFVQLPVGYIFGTPFFQKISEHNTWFAILSTVVESLLAIILTDFVQVSWKRDGSFSAWHLGLARACETLFSGMFGYRRKRKKQLHRMLESRWRSYGKKDDFMVELRSSEGMRVKSYFLILLPAVIYNLIGFGSNFVLNLGEVTPNPLSVANEPGYFMSVTARTNALADIEDWGIIGSRKCSLMGFYKENYWGEESFSNGLMGCGTHFTPANKVFFNSKSFAYDTEGDRIQIRATDQQFDPVGSGNLVLFVRGKEDPRIPKSETVTRGVLITLNPVATLEDSDTQVKLQVPTGFEYDLLRYNLTTYLDYYESLTPQQYISHLGKLEGQINDEPLVEFLEAMVQNIFGNSDYSLRLDSKLSREGGMDLGSFSYNGHVVLVFIVFSAGMIVARAALSWWTRSLAVRDLNDLADMALMSKIVGHSTATVLDVSDYRFEPTLNVTKFGPCHSTMGATAEVRARQKGKKRDPIEWDKEKFIKNVRFD